MKVSVVNLLMLFAVGTAREISIQNNCGKKIWISPLNYGVGTELGDIAEIADGDKHVYPVPDAGWTGRIWPKLGCDSTGQNCETGQSDQPCPDAGCQPPSDTKIEFYFPPLGNGLYTGYDVTLVDGYSLAVKIVPSVQNDMCPSSSCQLSLKDCPSNENDVGDLRIMKNNETVQCLAPCKKWNFPPPYGDGNPITENPGMRYCCPTGSISAEECVTGPVVNSFYVKLIHAECPTAYSYPFEQKAGPSCPNEVDFEVTYCP